MVAGNVISYLQQVSFSQFWSRPVPGGIEALCGVEKAYVAIPISVYYLISLEHAHPVQKFAATY